MFWQLQKKIHKKTCFSFSVQYKYLRNDIGVHIVICLKDKPLWLESGTEHYIKFAKNN